MLSGRTVKARWRRSIASVLTLLLSIALGRPAAAETTPAATAIVNTASLTHGVPDARETVSSNSVTVRVDAVIDVSVAARSPAITAPAASTDIPVAFVVTNLGNAPEVFALAATSGAALVTVEDSDGDGAYGSQSDRAAGQVSLAAGASRTVFVILPSLAGGAATVALTATAVTGHGAPGTVFGGAGVNGVDAVVGTTGAAATARTTVSAGTAAPSLAKSQSVVAPDGSARAVSQAVITYQLDARFPGATRDARIADDVPTGTVFVPGSIVVDGQPMTDAADGDAASFDGVTVRIALGDIAAAASRSVRFQTRIK